MFFSENYGLFIANTTTKTMTFQPHQEQAATELVSKWISRKVTPSIHYCTITANFLYFCITENV